MFNLIFFYLRLSACYLSHNTVTITRSPLPGGNHATWNVVPPLLLLPWSPLCDRCLALYQKKECNTEANKSVKKKKTGFLVALYRCLLTLDHILFVHSDFYMAMNSSLNVSIKYTVFLASLGLHFWRLPCHIKPCSLFFVCNFFCYWNMWYHFCDGQGK